MNVGGWVRAVVAAAWFATVFGGAAWTWEPRLRRRPSKGATPLERAAREDCGRGRSWRLAVKRGSTWWLPPRSASGNRTIRRVLVTEVGCRSRKKHLPRGTGGHVAGNGGVARAGAG